jgi:carbonic anhydrase
MLNYHQQNLWTNNFGQCQSPINLALPASELIMNHPIPLTTDDTYHLQTEIDDLTTIRVLGTGNAIIFQRPFTFQQLHFHVPSEHLLNGQNFPMEIHLVHQNTIGQKIVIAVFPQLGAPNPDLQAIMDHFKLHQQVPVNLNIQQWIPKTATGFHYLGSLTTPPLSEGVEWVVINNTTLSVSASQIKWFYDHFGANARDCQPLNHRQVEFYQ